MSPRPIPLYLYAKAPVAGRVKRRLCPPLNQVQATQAAQALLAHAINTVETCWPGQCVLSVTPDDSHPAFQSVRQSDHWQTTVQLQTDIGGRMGETLERGIAMSGKAAVLGTDIPSINSEVLQHAHDRMAKGQQVVGPSADGGFYFLGMNQSPRSLFDGIRWGTSEVYAKLMKNALVNGMDLEALPVLSDCDYYVDLQAAAKTIPTFANYLAQTGFDLGLLSPR